MELTSPDDIVAHIKAEAFRLGFSACGIVTADAVPEALLQEYDSWIKTGYHGDMDYLARNRELRSDPRILLPGTKSLIVVAMNYYPETKQHPEAPQFAYYAYGLSQSRQEATRPIARLYAQRAPAHSVWTSLL